MAKSKRDAVTGLQWGIVIVSILVTPVAMHANSILALSGPRWPLILYPFVQIVRSPGMNVPADLATPTAQWITYLQFPVYGLLVAKLSRSVGFLVGLGAAVLLHCVGMGIAYFLAHAHNLGF